MGSSSNTPSSSPNPIKHLTDSIVGLPSNESFANRTLAGNDEKGDSEKVAAATKSPSGRKPFIEWYMERKTELTAEMPEGSNASELTSFAMKKYKQTANNGGTGDTAASEVQTGKRKLDEKENEGSGIAKLAKFRVET